MYVTSYHQFQRQHEHETHTYTDARANRWNTNPMWKRNTILAAVGVALACTVTFSASIAKERRPQEPALGKTLMTQRWAVNAQKDLRHARGEDKFQ